ncbi:hypothetical protein AAVH_21045 [Aphelenchoides avenae]|nr:hypothetical protein AAVH_21045 [Aphelenchus avenae]
MKTSTITSHSSNKTDRVVCSLHCAFKPRDDPYVLYEELKEVLKKANPQLLARVNEEEKNFKHDRDTLGDEAKHFVDKAAVAYLEVAINTLKGQLPPQTDVYATAGKLRFWIRDLSPQAIGEVNGSAFFKSLISGQQ